MSRTRIPLAACAAVALAAGITLAASGGSAHAANPVPLPAALANHPFVLQKNPSDFASWGAGANHPGNCTANTSEITNEGSDIKLSTTGATGDCTDIESPHTYPTTDGEVYETYAYFSNWTQWDAFWMYGSNWPVDGEIDAVEGGSGTNYVSYHYQGSGGPASYSTCNNANGCDAGATPLQVGPSSANISPGWHTIDISYGGHGAGQGAVAVWYDGTFYGEAYGTSVLNGGTDPGYWIVWDTGSCNQPSNGNVCGSGGQTAGYVKFDWLRIFS